MTALLFALAGAAAGAIEVALLLRTARGRGGPASFLARLLLVAAVLVVGARAGHLVATAAGWLAGFAGSGAWVTWRLR